MDSEQKSIVLQKKVQDLESKLSVFAGAFFFLQLRMNSVNISEKEPFKTVLFVETFLLGMIGSVKGSTF